MGAETIVAIDVASAFDTSSVNMGDSLSGWWVLLNKLNPFRSKTGQLPELTDIQSRLAYVSSVKQLEDVRQQPGCFYLAPPVLHIGLMDFGRYKDTEEIGYQYGKQIIAEWTRNRTLEDVFGVKDETKESHARRASI